MRDESKSLSEKVLSLLESRPFVHLTGAEKEIVLDEITEDEYDLMYEATLYSQVHAAGLPKLSGRYQSLMAAYDRQYAPSKTKMLLLPFNFSVLRAAGVVLGLTLSVIATYFVTRNAIPPSLITQYDTVYVKTPAIADAHADLVTEDTLAMSSMPRVDHNATRHKRASFSPPPAIGILGIDDIEDAENSLRHNSLMDDSLGLTFNFISI
jgi:hypothetical protein